MSKLLFVSFFSGIKGNCPAEWADDKIDVLSRSKIIFLITCIYSKHVSNKNFRVYKIPSLSIIDFITELKESKNRGISVNYYGIIPWIPLIILFGSVIDLIQIIIKRKISGAKLSWSIPAFILMTYLVIIYRIPLIFATGGAMSAQLASSIFGIFSSKRIICEFQDPMVGSSMRVKSLNVLFEKFIIIFSSKVAFVTKNARDSSRKRHPRLSHKIFSYYPGSKALDVNIDYSPQSKNVTLVHIGTLYGKRNLDKLIEAIKEAKKILPQDCSVKILNVGEIYCDEKENYINSGLVEIISEQPRHLACKYLDNCIPLLIQHEDRLSEETIPYKTYDYLNSGKIIFGILYSKELFDILDNGKNLVSYDNFQKIVENIVNLFELESYQSIEKNSWTTEDFIHELIDEEKY